jgi:hypothetical protein
VLFQFPEHLVEDMVAEVRPIALTVLELVMVHRKTMDPEVADMQILAARDLKSPLAVKPTELPELLTYSPVPVVVAVGTVPVVVAVVPFHSKLTENLTLAPMSP